MMELSRRLEKIASFVTQGNCVADIGCDHGYVPIWLVEHGISPAAIAADVRPGPLERAAGHIRAHGLSERIAVRQSDGLEGIRPGEVQCLIFSGMGGPLMIRLLEEGEETARTAKELVLSPQSELEQVRRFLIGNGYQIDREAAVEEEGKFYFIFHVTPQKDDSVWTPQEYAFGRSYEAGSRQTVLRFLRWELKKTDMVLQSLSAADTQKNHPRVMQIEAKRVLIRKRMEELLENSTEGELHI